MSCAVGKLTDVGDTLLPDVPFCAVSDVMAEHSVVQDWDVTKDRLSRIRWTKKSLKAQGSHGCNNDKIIKNFTCLKCSTKFSQSSSLNRHRRKCEGLFQFSCPHCAQLYYRKDTFRCHLLTRHGLVDPALGPPGYTMFEH